MTVTPNPYPVSGVLRGLPMGDMGILLSVPWGGQVPPQPAHAPRLPLLLPLPPPSPVASQHGRSPHGHSKHLDEGHGDKRSRRRLPSASVPGMGTLQPLHCASPCVNTEIFILI